MTNPISDTDTDAFMARRAQDLRDKEQDDIYDKDTALENRRRTAFIETRDTLVALMKAKWPTELVSSNQVARELKCSPDLLSRTVRRFPMYFTVQLAPDASTRRCTWFTLHPHLARTA
jgi:hypothetical protein